MLCLADVMAAAGTDGVFVVPAGDLGFSVTVFCGCGVACLGTLVARRKLVGGCLGGPSTSKKATAVFFLGLWCVYIAMSWLKVESII